MAERSLSMREAPGSIPGLSMIAVKCTSTKDLLRRSILSYDMNGAHEQLFFSHNGSFHSFASSDNGNFIYFLVLILLLFLVCKAVSSFMLVQDHCNFQ